ncbi:hypothetical protein DERP_012158 [Dermatophagoides pteronyssinus]|uniref:Uncharacterized protein n=1 Tax=Dermatophagoides pteronyssinus TaxID=6956 RepID=A0ABQ8J295_DERPT|nr:hypothetical protein DERP_012158 [Dermatophagoides pteronyssinus]
MHHECFAIVELPDRLNNYHSICTYFSPRQTNALKCESRLRFRRIISCHTCMGLVLLINKGVALALKHPIPILNN